MSRKEEYWTLIQTLNETPAALDGAVDRARARLVAVLRREGYEHGK